MIACLGMSSEDGTPSPGGKEDHQENGDEHFCNEMDSSQPPQLESNGGREHEDGTPEDLGKTISDLQTTVKYLSHQMVMIMRALHVQSCTCELCTQRFHSNGLPTSLPTSPLVQQLSLPLSEYAQRPGGGKIPGLIDRRTVSEYALQHGGLAAVRRFGVPAPVASYYQRKDSKQQLLGGVGGGSPGPSTEADGVPPPAVVESTQSSSTPTTPNAILNPVMENMLRMNAAHTTGSPGFLRGRGRGRPKLIGDELDADLVEYMVQLKKHDPNMHLSASQALEIARSYIMEKAPGLLEEHGGHVKLKLTWAMKLVSRIAERQREIELGLPPGTLQNMGRGQFAEMVALSTQLNMPHTLHQIQQQSLHHSQSLDGIGQSVSATSEIVNMRELDLSHLVGGGDGGSDDGHSHQPSAGSLPVIGANGEIIFLDGVDQEDLGLE